MKKICLDWARFLNHPLIMNILNQEKENENGMSSYTFVDPLVDKTMFLNDWFDDGGDWRVVDAGKQFHIFLSAHIMRQALGNGFVPELKQLSEWPSCFDPKQQGHQLPICFTIMVPDIFEEADKQAAASDGMTVAEFLRKQTLESALRFVHSIERAAVKTVYRVYTPSPKERQRQLERMRRMMVRKIKMLPRTHGFISMVTLSPGAFR